MDRNDAIRQVREMEQVTKQSIPIGKYIRKKIVQEEVVEAYVTPLPTSVKTPQGNMQVNKGQWVIIHLDGQQETYSSEDFFKTFEPLEKK